MNMTIDEKIDMYKEKLDVFIEPLDRYQFLMDQFDLGDTLPEEYKVDNFKINGCVSQVWLVPRMQNGILTFMADSDALITKGVVKVLCDIYSGRVPWEVTANTRDITEELNFGNILSMNRRNGAYNMIKKIKEYAEQCKTSLTK